MSINLNREPYFDDYDPSKQYTKILAVPGRAEQAREFTQIQTLLLDVIKRLSETVLKEGKIVSGMSFTINGDDLIVQDGRIYLDGIIHEFKKQSVKITKQGREQVGVRLEQKIVTEAEDSSLRDPSRGFSNYQQPGAHRVKSVPVLTINDPNSHIIYEFMDGVLRSDPDRPDLDVISDILARRTYDEAGNYKVSGLDVWAENRNKDQVTVQVDAGKAYILGYEVVKPSAERVIVDKPKDVSHVYNEPKLYNSEISKYYLNMNPVDKISTLTATVQITQNITRGSVGGGLDYLPNTPVVEIVSIYQGQTEYIQGTDFALSSNAVDWALPGKEPTPGSSYTITYRYNKKMVEGEDFELKYDGEGDERKFYVEIKNNDVVTGTQINIDYSYFLGRGDLISLSKDGEIIVTKGQPAILSRVIFPNTTDPELLNLGTILHPPDSNNVYYNSRATTRLSMEELQKFVTRIKDLEYNMALTALDQEAINAETGLLLKGIFSDGFGSTSRGDVNHPDFSVGYDLVRGEIGLRTGEFKLKLPSLNEELSRMNTWGRLVTAPMYEVLEVSQKYATGTMLVNPYRVFNQLGTLELKPKVDNWIDEEIIVENRTVDLGTINTSLWSNTSRVMDNYQGFEWSSHNKASVTQTITGVRTTSASETILEEAVTFMRQRDVEFEATNLIPYSDNLVLTFGGEQVDITPIDGTQPGTQPGTVKADANGVAKGKFRVPAGVRTGTREVTLYNDNNTAYTEYTSMGMRRVTQQTVLTSRVTIRQVDPLAQSFQFDQARLLTSVGLFFSAIDPNKNITVQIRNMVNGYPGQEVYEEKVLRPEEINVSDNGSAETKVVFDNPVMCEVGRQYCVTIMSDSDIPSMFIADLGGVDLITKETVGSNPYAPGVLFSSSNAITWTAHQSSNLKFNLYTARFEPEGVIQFDPIENLGADRVMVLANQLTPSNTGAEWEISINGKPFEPIGTWISTDLDEVANTVELRAKFKSSTTMSPIISFDNLSLAGFLTEVSGSYISLNTEFSQVYTEVKQVFDAYVPSGCSVEAQFSYDGTNWITAELQKVEPVDQQFSRYTYLTNIPESENATNFRARINITASNSILRPRVRRFINVVR